MRPALIVVLWWLFGAPGQALSQAVAENAACENAKSTAVAATRSAIGSRGLAGVRRPAARLPPGARHRLSAGRF
jgi:hypothetical protein